VGRGAVLQQASQVCWQEALGSPVLVQVRLKEPRARCRPALPIHHPHRAGLPVAPPSIIHTARSASCGPTGAGSLKPDRERLLRPDETPFIPCPPEHRIRKWTPLLGSIRCSCYEFAHRLARKSGSTFPRDALEHFRRIGSVRRQNAARQREEMLPCKWKQL
jgi:hypothetical protein